MKKLFYVRHGETEMNVAGIWSGQIETPLTKNGRQQARVTGKRIQQNFPKIDLIVCSPYSRAHHTAQIIAEQVGYPHAEILQNELFIERAFGVLEGTPTSDFNDNNNFEDLDNIEKSESVIEVHDRAVKAYEYLQTLPQDNILVVSHGTFGRALRRVIEGIPHTHEYDEAHRDNFRLGNAEVIELI